MTGQTGDSATAYTGKGHQMDIYPTRKRNGLQNGVVLGLALLMLTGCEEGAQFNPFKPQKVVKETADGTGTAAGQSVKLIERDVEAPEVFQVTDTGLWDGRPSLGGVWVAHPDVIEPERVIIRSTSGSKFVIGALFRKERETPGPILQVSSDAAAALGMLAGAPTELNVTALRRETAPDPEAQPAEETAVAAAPTEELEAPAEIEATALDPVAGAAAAIEEAELAGAVAVNPEPEPQPKPRATSSLEKPFIQIGIFSVEQNAQNTATAMRQAGMVPTVINQKSQGKTFWRVIVGPATTKSERSVLLKKIKGIGFDDAYPVTN